MTDLTPPEHEHSAIVDQAIEHYSAHYGQFSRPIIPNLQRMFGLTPHQAVVVVREVTLRRARAA